MNITTQLATVASDLRGLTKSLTHFTTQGLVRYLERRADLIDEALTSADEPSWKEPLNPPDRQAIAAVLLPVRLDVDKSAGNWTYSVRDKRNRQLLTINAYLPEREAIGEAVVRTLNALAEPVRCVLVIEGGCASDITATIPIEVLVIDYNTECIPTDELCSVDQGEHHSELAVVSEHGAEVVPEYVNPRFAKYRATEGKEC